jgi:hypothetical protein
MYRVTGIGTSLILLAVGAVLAWAVDVDTNGFNVNTIGVILFVIGLVGLIVSLLVGFAIGGSNSTTVVDRGTTVVDPPPTRERVVERDRF